MGLRAPGQRPRERTRCAAGCALIGEWQSSVAKAEDASRCWHAPCFGRGMAPAWRVLLWILVVIAPGGVLLLPLLAADALRRRTAAVPAISERTSLPPERLSWVEFGRPSLG